ncbi:MAG: 30S ribosomal protein S20 [bacterium]
MPITSSAKKALRASKNKKVYNTRRKDAMGDTIKNIKKLVAEKKVKEAEAIMSAAYKAIDKASKAHVIHKNTASRKKSRLAKLVNKAK